MSVAVKTTTMMRFVLLFCLVVVGTLAIESNFYHEEGCAGAKGYCVLESECPHSVTAEHKNLCPGQKKNGAICCTNFPEAEVNCNQLHNACLDGCPKSLNLGRKGCSADKTCCVLVK